MNRCSEFWKTLFLSFRFYNSYFDDLYQVGGNVSMDNDTVYVITEFTKVLLFL